jgi:antitoxin CptB
MAETAEIRLKRLRMRSWRRGTREMDMILGPFADRELAALGPEQLDVYEALLSENDQDLYQWMSGRVAPPPEHAEITEIIRATLAQAKRRGRLSL